MHLAKCPGTDQHTWFIDWRTSGPEPAAWTMRKLADQAEFIVVFPRPALDLLLSHLTLQEERLLPGNEPYRDVIAGPDERRFRYLPPFDREALLHQHVPSHAGVPEAANIIHHHSYEACMLTLWGVSATSCTWKRSGRGCKRGPRARYSSTRSSGGTRTTPPIDGPTPVLGMSWPVCKAWAQPTCSLM